jgi:hypothetical protein
MEKRISNTFVLPTIRTLYKIFEYVTMSFKGTKVEDGSP